MSSRNSEIIAFKPGHSSQGRRGQSRDGGGERLPETLCSEMSARFGVSFAQVRVQRDAAAAEEAKHMGLQAFARGDEIAFAAGRYDPATIAGKRLVAHELAHVAQQRRGGSISGAEQRADRAADEALAGRTVDSAALGGAPIGIHGQADKSATPDASPKADEKELKSDPAGHTSQIARNLDKFQLDKDNLTPGHAEAIDELVLSISLRLGLLARGSAQVEIVGHTDSAGSEEHNTKLGQGRADRVKQALEKALSSEKVSGTVSWSVRSAGRSEPLIPNASKHEPRNRRVEVRVTIVSLPEPKKPPQIDVIPKGPIFPDEPIGPPWKPKDDPWRRMEEIQRKIDEFDRKNPKKSQSVQDVIIDSVMDSVIDPLINKLPISKSLKDKAREGIRDGLEAGMEKACEAAIDATGVKGAEAEALQSACEAAIKMKSGEKGSGGSR